MGRACCNRVLAAADAAAALLHLPCLLPPAPAPCCPCWPLLPLVSLSLPPCCPLLPLVPLSLLPAAAPYMRRADAVVRSEVSRLLQLYLGSREALIHNGELQRHSYLGAAWSCVFGIRWDAPYRISCDADDTQLVP